MADINKLKDKIRSTIYPNGKGAINASEHQALLLDMADGMAETDTKLATLSKLEKEGITIKNGINLFNSNDEDVLIDTLVQGNTISSNGSYNTSGFIPVDVGKTYYCASDAEEGFRIVNFCDSKDNVFDRVASVREFTVPENCKYVRVVFSKAAWAKAQVSLNSYVYHEYEAPYVELVNKMGSTNNSVVTKEYVDKFGIGIKQSEIVSGIVYSLIDISAKKGEVLYIKLEGTWSRVLVIYNEVLSNRLVDSSSTAILSGKWYRFIAPEEIRSVGVNIIDGSAKLTIANEISSLAERTLILEESVETLKQEVGVEKELVPNSLYGKKYVACGDSFTAGDFTGSTENNVFTDAPYEGENKVYPFFIGRRTGAVVINEAKNGSTMAYIDGSRNEFSTENGRYTQIPEDADYVTLYFGINDSHQSVPVGTIDDVVNTTFYGAWNIVMTWLLNNRPYAKIGIIITNGSTPAYTDAERNIAKKYGVPFLDLELDEQIPYMLRQNERVSVPVSIRNLRDNQFKVGSGNSHPNAKCHELESTFIESFLLRL